MTQDEKWESHYRQLTKFVLAHKRRPSKYHPEERQLLNWLKYTKKLLSAGKLTAKRAKKFERLQQLLKDYQRINQYVYVNGDDTPELELEFAP